MVALALIGSASTVTISWSLAFFISQIFIQHASFDSVGLSLLLIGLGGAAKALVLWLQEFMATKASAAVKIQLRQKLFDAIGQLGPGWLANRSIAQVNLLATTGLDALEPYFSKFLPQLVYTALITPVLLVIIWSSDLSSGITLLVTLPLIPIFMILIGWATRSIQAQQFDALMRLSQHFLEVLRGLTTLKIFGRAEAQVLTLRKVSEEHRLRTMRVLRVTFLSGFALELIASLSVALIAVSIGLRLLSGDMTLAIGLFVLLLAPEAYLPIRQVGAQFHASAEGVSASKALLDIIDEAKVSRDEPVVENVQLSEESFRPGVLTVITGPSGIGKSKIFSRAMGFDNCQATLDSAHVSWMPQRSKLFPGNVVSNIVGVNVVPEPAALEAACALAALDDVELETAISSGGTVVSGGQMQRICLARAFYRALVNNAQYLLLDEPISAIDSGRAEVVVAACRSLANRGMSVVVISHQQLLIDAADEVVAVTHG